MTAKHRENWLKTTIVSITRYFQQHLLSKAEERSMQPWDNKMQFLVILGVWIPPQVLEEMRTHRHPMSAGCCATSLTLLCWITFVGRFEVTHILSGCPGCQLRTDLLLTPLPSLVPVAIPTSFHCCLSLFSWAHTSARLVVPLNGASQLFSSCHLCKSLCGKSSSFHGKTGQMVPKPQSQQCL